MKYRDAPTLETSLLSMSHDIGRKLARLRQARRMRQADAAVRAGIARSTAALIEAGDPGRTLSQVLRYLNAISPGASLLDLLLETEPALAVLHTREQTRRVRQLSESELKELDF
ncbi:MAG: helix-turn-helix domain-containing protein [Cytophagales bacterium]|nr:helix-turn-helix domain-containing protein [Rhizobacter sp.]